jgi:CDP-diacylglycerol---glycerol-3-phosphate 3-phosphatidyltransferase
MDIDALSSLTLLSLLVVLSGAYVVRVARSGRAHHPRVDAEGKSALLAKDLMEMMCWSVQPVVTLCARLRLTPDAVTYASLVLGCTAGVALGAGHFGLGALLATVAAGGDAIDGLLARRLGVGSVAGEVLDAAVDRYVDFALLAGVAFHFRADGARLCLVLAAILASFMVSYSTAKAESLHVAPPRGSMRRVERAVLLVGAAALTPAAVAIGGRWPDAPMLLALATIAILGNVSAVQRLASIRAVVRARARDDEAHAPRAGKAAAE